MTDRRYDTTTEALGVSNRATRSVPVFAPTIAANVGVVVLQSMAVACASFGVFAGIYAFGVTGHAAWMLLTVWAASFGLAFAWRARVIEDGQVAVETIETPAQVQPGVSMLDMPALPEPPNIVLLNPNKGQALLAAETRTVDRERWEMFIRGCAVDTSSRRWRKLKEYEEWKADLLASAWARRIGEGPTAPWRLTASPEEIIAALQSPPLPRSEA